MKISKKAFKEAMMMDKIHDVYGEHVNFINIGQYRGWLIIIHQVNSSGVKCMPTRIRSGQTSKIKAVEMLYKRAIEKRRSYENISGM